MFTPADMDVYHSAHIECNSCRIAGLAVGWVTRFVDGSKTCDRSRLIESKYVSAGDSGINGEGMVAGWRKSSTVPTRDLLPLRDPVLVPNDVVTLKAGHQNI
jgi:hypothetical protein